MHKRFVNTNELTPKNGGDDSRLWADRLKKKKKALRQELEIIILIAAAAQKLSKGR